MPAAFRSASSNSASAACTTGVTVTKPSGVVSGDVMYAFVSKTNYSNTAPFTCNNWADITTGTTGITTNNDRHVTILRKRVTDGPGEAANYTFVTTFGTTCTMSATIICVSDADMANTEDIAVANLTFGNNDATPASQNATSATVNTLALTYCQLSLATTALKTFGAPNTYALDAGATTGLAANSLNNQQGVAYKSIAAAGGTAGTNVWTNTADDATTEFSTVTILVRSGDRPISSSFDRNHSLLQATWRAATW